MFQCVKVLILALLIGGTARAEMPAPNSKHHIFYVHGIGGSAKSFGVMPVALRQRLHKEKPDVDYLSHVFVYKTEDDSLTTDDFAIQLGDFIERNAPDLGPNDKISIVAHSQGGLVSTIWFFHAMQGNPEFHPELARHMDAFITLGTPFWGSKGASYAIEKDTSNWFIRRTAKPLIKALGRRQLVEMAMGSTTIMRFRKNVSRMPEDLVSQIGSQIRPLTISGVFDGYRRTKMPKVGGIQIPNPVKLLNPLVFGDKYFESDSAVLVPSARFDSHYSVEEPAEEGALAGRMKNWTTHFSPHLIVMGIHATYDAEEYKDIVEVPASCYDLSTCTHPTYPWIVKHFLGQPIPQAAPDTHPLEYTGFQVSTKLIFPEGTDANDLKGKVKITYNSRTEYQDFDVLFEPEHEVVNHYEFVHPNHKNEMIITSTGNLKVKNAKGHGLRAVHERPLSAVLLIEAPGFMERLVPVRIQPTYSSYVEFSMRPVK